MKADGIDFAMIRLGYRGYGTGNIVIDDQFTENINGALEAGLEGRIFFLPGGQCAGSQTGGGNSAVDVVKLSDYDAGGL